MRIRLVALGVVAVAILAGLVAYLARPGSLSPEDFAAQYQTPLPPPDKPLTVYHLGHSLVGRDMPAMLAQMAGHDYRSQLGWGASLQNHWTGEIPGFEAENTTDRFEPARDALASGRFDTLVLTEMVEIKDAIAFHDSADFLARWVRLAREGNPDIRVYLYETWHDLDDPDGWLDRIDADLGQFWEGQLLRPAMAEDGVGTIYVIPGGQVMAAVVRDIDAGQIPGLTRREDLFARSADGTQDMIHFNDIGAYLMALTHYAVLYGRSPVGLPNALKRADGTDAVAPGPETARLLQEIVWRVVTSYAPSGVAPTLEG